MTYLAYYESPLGKIILRSDGKSLTGLCFESQKYQTSSMDEVLNDDLPIFKKTIDWLDIYFGGGIPSFTPSLSLSGTEFQKEVWNILKDIPYGQTMTYGEVAEIIAKRRNIERMSSQAVGQAVGHNPIAIIIPCHRIVGANGKMTGYAGGIDKKIALLNLEKMAFNQILFR